MECLEKAGCSQDKSRYMENGILKAFDIKKPNQPVRAGGHVSRC